MAAPPARAATDVAALDNAGCLSCHDAKAHKLEVPAADGKARSLLGIAPDKYAGSVHAKMQCVACHTGITDNPAAGVLRGIGHLTHEAIVASTVNQLPSTAANPMAYGLGTGSECRSLSHAGAAVHGKRKCRCHGEKCFQRAAPQMPRQVSRLSNTAALPMSLARLER